MPARRPLLHGPRRWALATATLVALCLMFVAQRAAAGPGELDAGWGGAGIVVMDWHGIDEVRGLAVQPDGKILVGGIADRRRVVVRYMPDGALDGGFGRDGIAGGTVLPADALPPAMTLSLRGDGSVVLYSLTPGALSTWLARPGAGASLSP